MKETPDMRLFFLSCFLCCSLMLHAQLKQIPIRNQNTIQKKQTATRIQGVQSLSAMNLPFWDDFSNSKKDYPSDSLWQFGHSIWVNDGMAINPPTLKVATFDGLDSLRLPYNVNTPLSKGIADKLVSRPIRMDLVNPSQKSSVFISFYYQFQGNGESPDQGDDLSLWFKNDSSIWKQVWSAQYDTTKDNTKFVPVKIFVNDTCAHCFHKDFQFKFQNYARLSGPFDTWNLDYVYVSNGITLNDTTKIPDRGIVSPMTSVLKQYRSMPAKHLLSNPGAVLNRVSIVASNQREDQLNQVVNGTFKAGQPVTAIGHLKTTSRLNNVVSSDTSYYGTTAAQLLAFRKNTIYTFDSIPRLSKLDPAVDSIALHFKMFLRTKDNINKATGGDFDPVIYKGIDFRVNDTIQTDLVFVNYYAYDDGIAEYAATLTQPGNYFAYQFDMLYDKADTLVAVDIYFPHVGDETNQVVQLIVYDTLDSSNKRDPLTQQALTVSRTDNNQFTRVKLAEPVVVSQRFFVGYKQNTNATIGIGFDKNSGSSGKIFTNLGTGWQQSDLEGSLMIRPVFGNPEKAKGPITTVEEKKLFTYPNPNRGVFHLPEAADNIQVLDLAGRAVSFELDNSSEPAQVTLRSPVAGVYLVRYFNGSKWQAEKIMVLP